MFVKENKHKLNMNFEIFLNLIARIAEIKYSETADTSADALNLLLENHLLPLYENIIKETDMGEDETKFREEIDDVALSLFKEVVPIFLKIY